MRGEERVDRSFPNAEPGEGLKVVVNMSLGLLGSWASAIEKQGFVKTTMEARGCLKLSSRELRKNITNHGLTLRSVGQAEQDLSSKWWVRWEELTCACLMKLISFLIDCD